LLNSNYFNQKTSKMKLYKFKLNLHLENAPKEIDKKYYAILGAIYDLLDNQKVFELALTSISHLVRTDENNFSLFVSIFWKEFSDLFLQKLFEKQKINIDTLPFKLDWVNLIKEFNLVNFQPQTNYKKILITLQSPTCFGGKNNKPFLDIQGFNMFKSVNKKLLKLKVDINLDLFELEKNIKLIWVKNLNSEKVWLKNGYKIGLTWKLFYEISWTENFKKQIHYLTEVIEFLGIGLNPRLGLGNAYGKILVSPTLSDSTAEK